MEKHLYENIQNCSVVQKKFYFISFNILCYVEEQQRYVPIEVGLVEYTIQDGIIRSYHTFIDPGPVPFGYTSVAITHSEDTHRIPITAFDKAERNYFKIYNEMTSFIKPMNTKTKPTFLVFCLQKDIQQTRGCLEWLHRASNTDSRFMFHVCDVSLLLLDLKCEVDDPLYTYKDAEALLTKSDFDYTPDTKCSYHEDEDCSWCALGFSRRLCYLLSDAICALFGIAITSKHLPLKVWEKRYGIPNMINVKVDMTKPRPHYNVPDSRKEPSFGRPVERKLQTLPKRAAENVFFEKESLRENRPRQDTAAWLGDSNKRRSPNIKNPCEEYKGDFADVVIKSEGIREIPFRTSTSLTKTSTPEKPPRQPRTIPLAFSIASAGIGRGSTKKKNLIAH